jgi:hypothetical protein
VSLQATQISASGKPLSMPSASQPAPRKLCRQAGCWGDTTPNWHMISFVIHTLFICFIGTVVFWLVDQHERDARMARLLKFLVVTVGTATIVHRFLPLIGVGF